jgi:Tol biopolymer transport system component
LQRSGNRISRVSINTDGDQANANSVTPSISADGRFVAFASLASNLVPNDTNQQMDVFVHDRQLERTIRASVGLDGLQADGPSWAPAMSSDGRYVAFVSEATNLDPNDRNFLQDVFIHDRLTSETFRASIRTDGLDANGLSGEPHIAGVGGRYVVFKSYATNLSAEADNNGTSDVFLHDRVTGNTRLVTLGLDGTTANGTSDNPVITEDGRYIVYDSWASNLVASDRNSELDVFLRDMVTGQTTILSVDREGFQGNFGSLRPGMSTDGRFVVFESKASNLVPDDTNGVVDVFVRGTTSPPVSP